jgi:1-phosphatidylinositol-3-phosphate 5-kinase
VDFANLATPLCEHTTLNTKDPKDILRCRSNIIRHFNYKSHIISFSTSPVQDVYEVRIPRVQITKVRALTAQQRGGTIRDTWQSAERDKLRLEITMWWKGVKDHMNQLEEVLDDGQGDLPLRKPLPPSPPPEGDSMDDTPTPKANNKPLPPDTETIPAKHDNSKAPSSVSEHSQLSTASSIALLSTLRKAFSTTEQSLYTSLNQTPIASINDVRRLFYSTSQAAANRLIAWEKKHADSIPTHKPYQEPDWWASGFHALPGGSIIVKEGEWASMIAFTLSSSDYINELNEMNNPRATSSIGATAGSDTPSGSTITVASSQTEKSVLSRVESFEGPISTSLNVFVSSMQALTGSKQVAALDPDDDSLASQWHNPEMSSSQVSRKENPKDGSNIMSLRDVLRNKAATDVNSLTSRFTGVTGANSVSSSKLEAKLPPMAFGAASLELAKANAQGSVLPPTPDATNTFERILKDADSDDYALIDSINSESAASTIKASQGSRAALPDSLHGKEDSNGKTNVDLAPMVPPKDRPTGSSAATTPTIELTLDEAMRSESGSTTSPSNPAFDTSISAMGSLTSTIANAMRFVLNVGQRAHEDKPLPPINHHGLLTMESPEIDPRPHIKYECVVGKRLKLSCTVYYAKQFDSLRKRCGIDEEFIQSLKKTENWAAEGTFSFGYFYR